MSEAWWRFLLDDFVFKKEETKWHVFYFSSWALIKGPLSIKCHECQAGQSNTLPPGNCPVSPQYIITSVLTKLYRKNNWWPLPLQIFLKPATILRFLANRKSSLRSEGCVWRISSRFLRNESLSCLCHPAANNVCLYVTSSHRSFILLIFLPFFSSWFFLFLVSGILF